MWRTGGGAGLSSWWSLRFCVSCGVSSCVPADPPGPPRRRRHRRLPPPPPPLGRSRWPRSETAERRRETETRTEWGSQKQWETEAVSPAPPPAERHTSCDTQSPQRDTHAVDLGPGDYKTNFQCEDDFIVVWQTSQQIFLVSWYRILFCWLELIFWMRFFVLFFILVCVFNQFLLSFCLF